jgi:hypothetical protein
MEKDNEQNEEREPWITFHAYALEMWFWRVAVPVALIVSLLK